MKTYLKETDSGDFYLYQLVKKQEVKIEGNYDLSRLISVINNRRQGIFNAHDIKWALSFGVYLEAGIVLPDFKKYTSNTEQFIDSICLSPWTVKIENGIVEFI